MSTFLYNNARGLFATAQLNWLTANVQAMLVDVGYSALPTDLHVSDIPPSAIIARDAALTSLAQVNGVCKGVIPAFNALVSPNAVVAVVLYVNTTNDATSPLIYYSSDGVGFPFGAVGFNYGVSYDQSNGGFFQL